MAELALHGKSEMVQLKAIEVLNKMQGYNESSSVQHNHVHLQVNAALIEELRKGYAALAERSAKACLPLPDRAGLADDDRGHQAPSAHAFCKGVTRTLPGQLEHAS